jgi:hypothetical protein
MSGITTLLGAASARRRREAERGIKRQQPDNYDNGGGCGILIFYIVMIGVLMLALKFC